MIQAIIEVTYYADLFIQLRISVSMINNHIVKSYLSHYEYPMIWGLVINYGEGGGGATKWEGRGRRQVNPMKRGWIKL